MYIHLCTLRAVRAAPVAAMAREPLLHAIVLLLCCYVDAPGQKRIPHLFCPHGRSFAFDPLTNSKQVHAGWVLPRQSGIYSVRAVLLYKKYGV